jgi:hypothetical protein
MGLREGLAEMSEAITASDAYGLEHTRYRARRAHRHAGVPALERHRLTALQVRGDHCDGTVELFQGAVLHGLVDELLQRLALEKAAVGQRVVAEHGLVEIQRNALQGEAIIARRIQRTDQAARAGPDDDLGLNALRLESFDHADVRKAFGRTAAQHQGNAWRRDLDRDRCWYSGAALGLTAVGLLRLDLGCPPGGAARDQPETHQKEGSMADH